MSVVAIDPPGHGQSDPAAQIRWEDVADILAAVAEAHGLADLLLVGHSAGATALVFGAAGVADRVQGLVLADGAFHEGGVTGDDDKLRKDNEDWVKGMTYPDWTSCLADAQKDLQAWDADIEAGIRDLFEEKPDGTVRVRGDVATITKWAVLLRDYRIDDVPRLDAPALVLWAAGQRTPEPPGIGRLRRRLPRLEAKCLVGSGHEIFWDQPEAASCAVWSFGERF